ncbi:MAG: flagellar protein FlgN, partial [Mariprofundus sp.]|nr:flagellar protein FlgN [Mariprofundus sp.]
MVLTTLKPETLPELQTLLQKMDVCARELEMVVSQENAAIRALDSAQIVALTEHRVLIHQCLARLEKEGKSLLSLAGVPADMSMELLIDLYAGDNSGDFQAL